MGARRAPQVAHLRCEWAPDPLGIDARRPRLSWVLDRADRGAAQAAYELIVTTDGREIWRSGRVESPRSVAVPYAGEELRSRQRCEWRVRAWDERGRVSPWSDTARWEMGLLDPSDWVARWIVPRDDAGAKHRPCPLLRHEFVLPAACGRARLYSSAHGIYEIELNGARVGDELFRPGWTAYRRRLQYQTYDVTRALALGPNAIGVTLADGWWRGETTGGRRRNWYGSHLALVLQLEVEHPDGSMTTVTTGPGWRWSTGPVRDADFFRGEVYDATRELPGWSRTGFDARTWADVDVCADAAAHELVAQHGPGVRRTRELVPRLVLESPTGETVLDMGQNMVGWLRFRVDGPTGSTVTLRHGESLDHRGRFTSRNLVMPFAAPAQRVRYTLRGGGETYEPRYTTAGFRYVAVDGWPAPPAVDAFTGVVVGSELATTGTFSCSDPRLERLQECIVWSLRGNLVEIPTDCPTRERSGWTGDLQAFAPVALFNLDAVALLERWLRDLAADQGPDGNVPDVIPWVRSMRPLGDGTGSVGWGDAATIVPMLLHEATGDPSILERQLPSMLAWVGYLERRAQCEPRAWKLFSSARVASGHHRFVVDSGFHWGDHYPTGRDSVLRIGARLFRPPALLATAFLARSACVTARAARVIGRDDEADRLEALHANVVRAFADEFLDHDGRLVPDEQASYAIALAFGLVPDELRARAAGHLVEAVRRAGGHATTGFMGTPHLLPMLAANGHPDVAYDLLLQEEPPSWLAMVAQGATTIWESLRAVRPNGRLRFRSLNHAALGAVGEFLYRCVAGLDATRVGLGTLRIAPVPGGGLTSAEATYRSVHGICGSAWSVDNGRMRLVATVPPNVTAEIVLPRADGGTVLESGRPVAGSRDLRAVSSGAGEVTLATGAGVYDLEYPLGDDRRGG